MKTVVLLDYGFFFSENTFEHHIWGNYNFKGLNLIYFPKMETETELPSLYQVAIIGWVCCLNFVKEIIPFHSS